VRRCVHAARVRRAPQCRRRPRRQTAARAHQDGRGDDDGPDVGRGADHQQHGSDEHDRGVDHPGTLGLRRRAEAQHREHRGRLREDECERADQGICGMQHGALTDAGLARDDDHTAGPARRCTREHGVAARAFLASSTYGMRAHIRSFRQKYERLLLRPISSIPRMPRINIVPRRADTTLRAIGCRSLRNCQGVRCHRFGTAFSP